MDYDGGDKKLKLKYTSAALSTGHSSAGVLIKVPRTQLQEIKVGYQTSTTVLNGFGSQFKEAKAEDQAVLYLTVDSPTKLEINSDNQARITAKVTGTPSSLEVDAEGQSTLAIQGAITKAEAEDQATLEIEGGSTLAYGKAKDMSRVVVDTAIAGGCSKVVTSSMATCTTKSLSLDSNPAGDAMASGTVQMSCSTLDDENQMKEQARLYLRQNNPLVNPAGESTVA